MSSSRAKDLAMVIASATFFAGVIFLSPHKARAADIEDQKETARNKITSVCARPMPKNDALPTALNEAVKEDPKTWGPWILWWNDIVAERKATGCDDA